MDNNELDPAYYDFLEVDKIGGKEGAEAKYYMCEIAFRKDAYDAAETEIFGLIENYSSYSEWKFKGYLLLAEVYMGMQDFFQARATLSTIIENVDEEWVVAEANAKLQRLEAIEAQKNSEESEEEIEIDMNDPNNQ